MGDSYAEVLVHDEKDLKGRRLKLALAVLTISFLIYGAMYQMLFLLIGINLIPITILMIKNRYREFEYLLVSNELEVTVIKNKQKRQKAGSYTLDEMQCMAPSGSRRLDGFRAKPQLKVIDYSSGNPQHSIYSMIFLHDGMILEVKVEPSEKMLNGIKMHYPNIVFFD